MDPIETIEQCPEVIEHAKNATHSSCTSQTVCDFFINKGAKSCHHILEGFDYDVLGPVEPDDKYKADISFIGTKTKERDLYLKVLQNAGYDVKFYGPGYTEEVVNEEFAKVCSSSKYMLSLNTHNNIVGYFSDRLIRYLGCGTCTFHLDSTMSLNDYFEDGKEVIYFSDPDDLLEKIKGVTESEVMILTVNGREKVLQNYTWNNSIHKILGVVNNV